MTIGRPQGLAILILGLLLLVGGILVLISVPSWGDWIASYPAQVAQKQFPPQAAPIAQGMVAIFGPLLDQVGGYIRIVGYFAGSLLTLIAIIIASAGTMVIKRAASQT